MLQRLTLKARFDLALGLTGIFVGGLAMLSATAPDTFHPWTLLLSTVLTVGIMVTSTESKG